MKKYVLFLFSHCYPSGGLRDVEGSFDTIDEAKTAADENQWDHEYRQIVDRDTWKIVAHRECRYSEAEGPWIDGEFYEEEG